MARRSNTAERRAQIVAALARVLADVGYDAASVGAIAREAGLSQGLVHYHFASKLEVLVALVEHLAAGLEARVARRVAGVAGDGEAAAWARLDAWIDAHLALGDDAEPGSVAAWLVVGAEAARRPEVGRVYAEAVVADLEVAAGLVARVLEATGRPVDAAAPIARTLLAAVEGAFRLGRSAPSALGGAPMGPRVRHAARALIAAEGA